MSEKFTRVHRPTGDDENDAPSPPFQRDGNVRVAAEGEGTRTDGNRLEDRGADGPLPSRPNGTLNRPEDGRVSEIDRIQSLLDEEPLSLAEEIAEECDRTGTADHSRRYSRTLRADQAGRHPHRRAAADEHAAAHRAGPQGKPDRDSRASRSRT